MQMPEGKGTLTAPFKLFPGRICTLPAKLEAPAGRSVPQLGVFWPGETGDWDFFDQIEAREMGQGGGFVPERHAHPPATLPAATLEGPTLPPTSPRCDLC